MGSIVSTNLANAAIDEAGPLRLGVRLPRILETIAGLNACVVCLQELRICMDVDGVGALHPVEIARRVAQRANLTIAIAAPNNGTALSFWHATLYDAARIVHLKSIPIVIDVPGLTHGLVYLLSCFCARDGPAFEPQNSTFWVINIHYPIRGQLAIATWLVETIDRVLAENGWLVGQPVVMIGDHNTFVDVDGVAQLAKLGERFLMDTNTTPTFKSFPHNAWQGESVLDHAGVLRAAGEPARAALDLRVYPIDHAYSDHAIVELKMRV